MKLKISQSQINKMLKYIAYNKYNNDNSVPLDDNFFQGLKSLSREQASNILNSLVAEKLVEIIPAKYIRSTPTITLTPEAFSFFRHRREKFILFIVPTTISVIALLKAFDVELALLWSILTQ